MSSPQDSAAAPAGRWQRAVARGKALWGRLAARPGIAHLLAALGRFSGRLGNQFAAAITYFSFLSLVPILMVSFSIAGFVLASHPDVLDSLKDEVVAFVPGDLGDKIGNKVIDQAVKQRLAVGIIGLITALYSGLNWMNHVREAVRAQWRPRWVREERAKINFAMRYVWDLLSLAGLAVAVLVTFALTAVGTAAQDLVVGWLGVGDLPLLHTLLRIGPTVIAILADVLIFAWVYTILPFKDYRADRRTLLIGSLAMAIVFEILKSALTLLVSRMSESPSGAVFGSLLGLLLFFNLVARAFLMIAAWISTGAEAGQAAGPDQAGAVQAAGAHQAAGPDQAGTGPAAGSDAGVGDGMTDRDAAAATTVVLRDPRPGRHAVGFLGLGAVLGWIYGRRRR